MTENQIAEMRLSEEKKGIVHTDSQAGIFPANPQTLFVGNSQSHRKSRRI